MYNIHFKIFPFPHGKLKIENVYMMLCRIPSSMSRILHGKQKIESQRNPKHQYDASLLRLVTLAY